MSVSQVSARQPDWGRQKLALKKKQENAYTLRRSKGKRWRKRGIGWKPTEGTFLCPFFFKMGLTENSWCSRRNHSWKREGLTANGENAIVRRALGSCYVGWCQGASQGQECESVGGGVKFVLSAEAVVAAVQMINVWFFSSAPDGAVGISSSWAVVASMPHNEHRQAVGQSFSSPSWPLMGCSSVSKGNREQKVHHLCPLRILHCWCWEKEHWTRWTIAELVGDSSYFSSVHSSAS